jgi:glycosyltransferase involved in cell wall biosynthesis
LRLPGPVTAERTPMLRAIHAVCANGDALERIHAFLGDHVIELPIGLDVQLFTPGASSVRSALGWADHHGVVGYVGRLTHLKGVDLLAAAFREFAQDTVDARLLLVGSGEEERHIRAVPRHGSHGDAQSIRKPLQCPPRSDGVRHTLPRIEHRRKPEAE